MKYLVLLAILAVVLLLFFGRGRKSGPPGPGRKPPSDAPAPRAPPAKPAEMLACAHCGVHLPHSDAVFDVAGRPYCSPEHRVVGPR